MIEQLKTMLFINRLKSQHFSLEEIKSIIVINKNDIDRTLYTSLCNKMHDIQADISSLRTTLQPIHDDMQSLKKGKSVLSYLEDIDVELVDIPGINILYTRKALSAAECSQGYTIQVRKTRPRIFYRKKASPSLLSGKINIMIEKTVELKGS